MMQHAHNKPLPQGAPGRVIGIIGGIVAAGLIIGVAVTVFVVYRHQQKSRTETDNDLNTPSPCLFSADKPLPQGAPGRVIGIIGGIVAAGLIIGVAVTVFVVYRHQQKSRTETDNDLTDLPPAHKPAPPPPKKKTIEMKSHLTAGDIQVVHLDKPEEQLQKFPLQPPYYDMAPSESSPYSDTSVSTPPTTPANHLRCHTATLCPGRDSLLRYCHPVTPTSISRLHLVVRLLFCYFFWQSFIISLIA
ncbi:hypothetical protein EOD39_18238 [Acipenser ruthenus]|uniref:Uncharacterized protein n=1 Tax=Acipenser ruthenus TaxID=7906 RepID=A0A444V1D4_ACIRT|nr:hypothetical protein EOD39_18238 [Acipenser ruthenus]